MVSNTLPPFIASLDELDKELGPSFVVFIGSGVSRPEPPGLPMTDDVLAGVMAGAAENRTRISSWSEAEYPYRRLVARYASALGGDTFRTIRTSTKFETFLWHIETVIGRAALDHLLRQLYACQAREFGANHAALGALLLKSRRCVACLTTNFDNCLELAAPSLKVWSHPQRIPTLPNPGDKPVLIKLHGDAGMNTCVATSPVLSSAKRLGEYQYVAELLKGHIVLVLGYSANGDIDIAPHLRYAKDAYGVRFIWGVRNSGKKVPDFAYRRAQCNLEEMDPAKNLSLALAQKYGWAGSFGTGHHEWQDHLRKWTQSVDCDEVVALVQRTLRGQAGWSFLHVHHYAAMAGRKQAPLEHGKACLEIAAYSSAARSFERSMQLGGLSTVEDLELRTRLGFTQWRRGKLRQSLQTLSGVTGIGTWRAYDTESQALITEGCRLYLEVARDLLQYRRTRRQRMSEYLKWNVQQVSQAVAQMPHRTPRDEVLTRLVLLDIDRLVGRQVNADEVSDLYEECLGLQEWTAAEAAARSLIMISFGRGLKALGKVDKDLRKRGNWNTVRKSYAAGIHALFRGRLPVVLSVLDGPLFAGMKTQVVEFRYLLKRVAWRLSYRIGRPRTF